MRVRRPGVAAVVTAVALLVAVSATGASADEGAGTVRCDYFFSQWSGGFSADVRIANSGPAIDGWTVDLTFDNPSRLGATWSALMSQPDPYQMHAENMFFNGTIPTGGSVSFGWIANATAHEVPAMTVNGAPC